jgi:glutaredoxin-related protein
MADLQQIWADELPELRKAVTGVGVWAALNAAKPITIEGGVAYLGMPHEESELAGHLRIAHIKLLIEKALSARAGETVTLRVIDGTTEQDLENVKRKDAEAKRLQEQAAARVRAEVAAKSNWDTVYEQLNRKYASILNKSLPQNRAKFFHEAIDIVAEARRSYPVMDDLAERNYARCLERISQYTELPSVFVALQVMSKTGELGA